MEVAPPAATTTTATSPVEVTLPAAAATTTTATTVKHDQPSAVILAVSPLPHSQVRERKRLTKYGMCVRARVRACVHVTCVNHKEYLTEDNILQLES